jgi:S-adenosylmethionine:tRNA ribosyltransferase-isomerase
MGPESLDFTLPAALVATAPIERQGRPRHDARLLVLHKRSREIEVRRFRDITQFLEAGDVVVLNDSRTLNATMKATVAGIGPVELKLRFNPHGNTWGVTCNPDGALTGGEVIELDGSSITGAVQPDASDLMLRLVEFDCTRAELVDYLDDRGRPAQSQEGDTGGNADYNTVYARQPGSIEMPAAGRHFTTEVLDALRDRGVRVAFVTLHTGLTGLVGPRIRSATFEEHAMQREHYAVPDETATLINSARAGRRTVVAVGTTVMRTIETAARAGTPIQGSQGWTDLYIYPGFEFKAANAFVTNLHGPASSHLAMAAAFTGTELLMTGYREAIRLGFAFHEFGDATITLPD